MSSYFQAIRRLKDSNFYINALASQFALWKATQDQVDNPIYKAYSRATTNRLICRELAETPVQRDAEFYQPGIPAEPGPVGPTGGTVTVMINFDHELQDRSTFKNHALHEFTSQQLLFAEGKDTGLSFAVNFNPSSNSTYDKLWIPFSPSTQIIYDTPAGFSIFTRIMPTVTTRIGEAASPTPLSNRVKYHGGPVRNLHDAEVHVIWWGSDYNSGTAQSRRLTLQNDMTTVMNSDYYKGLWQYSDCKPVGSFSHVVFTGRPVPSYDVMTFDGDIVPCIKDARTAGVVPNWNLFEEFSPLAPTQNWDYRHIYVVILPWEKHMPAGYGGATSVTNDGGGTTLFSWCATYGPDNTQPVIAGYNIIQTVEQGLFHELIHAMVTPAVAGCVSGGSWLFDEPDFCNNIQHGPPGTGCGFLSDRCNCGSRVRMLTGTNVLVESYWSNMDGRCIAPGTGDTWTAEPVNMGPTVRRYIFQKLDDLDNGATAAIGDDGTVYFNVKKAATEYKVKSTAGAVVVGQWADIWFTFDSVANQARIYINNVLHNTASTEVLAWNNTHSHTILANYNMGATIGQYRGKMDDFRLYRSAVVTTQDVDNLNNNGLTVTGIENTAEQGVFIVNRVKIDRKVENTGVFVPADVTSGDVPAPTASFTTSSFTSSSFTL